MSYGIRHFVMWGTQTSAHSLQQTMEATLGEPFRGRFLPLPPLQDRGRLPAQVRQNAAMVAGFAIQEAQMHARAGEIVEGENALIRCIVLSC